MKDHGRNRLPALLFALILLLCAQAAFVRPALAGWNEVIVSTDGNGVPVYASSSGSKQAGIIYNGYRSEISLEPTNDRYSLSLTPDYTVWLNEEKATNRLPARSDYAGLDDWEAHLPCRIFLAEITEDGTPVYTSPKHSHLSAKHVRGTLVVVCGEFGDDYYLKGPADGFVSKGAVRRISDMTFSQAHSSTYIWEDLQTATIYASEAFPVFPSASAVSWSDDVSYIGYTSDRDVIVLRDLGSWVQLVGGRFVEKRFLDPDGDHTYPTARVKTDGILDRLNIRSSADTDAYSRVKLCSGVPVHIISRTDDWAVLYVTGPNGGVRYVGCAMVKYLSFDSTESVRDGSTPVLTTQDLRGDRNMIQFQVNGKGNVLPAGTSLTVVGVFDHHSSSSDQADSFLCETEDGLYVTVSSPGILEPVSEAGVTASVRSAVRMRTAPDPDAKVLRQVGAKTKVEVLLRGEIWTLVRYKGETGYMMSRYLSFP